MANSDKNILITPNTGSTTLNPTIRFNGANNTPITLRTLDTGTLSFEGTAGQLFSISDGLTGTIFSVNDISGIPSIEVLDTGLIKLAQYNGQVAIGSSTNNATVTVTGSTTFNTSASGFVKYASVIAPTADMFQVTNAGFPNITAGVSAMQISYVGGAAAVEATAARVDITPGTTSGGTWNGFRVVPTASAATGVTYNAMKFDSVTAGAGTDNIIYAGTGYDSILNYNGTTVVINGSGQLNLASVTGTLAVGNGGTGATTSTGSGAVVLGTSPTITPAAGTTTTATTGAGYMGMPQNAATTGAYGVVAADAGTHIYSTATRTVTLPANLTIGLPIGTAITFISGAGATTTIAITTDTMYLAGTGATGSRTLVPYGMATAVKIASTTWIISGSGLT